MGNKESVDAAAKLNADNWGHEVCNTTHKKQLRIWSNETTSLIDFLKKKSNTT